MTIYPQSAVTIYPPKSAGTIYPKSAVTIYPPKSAGTIYPQIGSDDLPQICSDDLPPPPNRTCRSDVLNYRMDTARKTLLPGGQYLVTHGVCYVYL